MWDGAPLEPDVRDAYLARLGVAAEAPSADALRRLHRAHVERVPYETLWIHAGERWGIDTRDSAVRIATQGRGGYCYHLNGAFGLLLRSLGYAVTPHAGGVHGPDGPDEGAIGNHLVLTVSDLPSDDHPDGVWYVDAGLGDALHEPLPLVAGDYAQAPWQLKLTTLDNGRWHLAHDPAGGFSGMAWRTGVATRADFAAKHEWLSTAPESGFVQLAMAERRDVDGVDVVRGLVGKRIGAGAYETEPLTHRDDWFDLLAERFDLRFEHTDRDALDALWVRVLDAHRAWEAAGKP
jgi:arylamine N-acetyltransferase